MATDANPSLSPVAAPAPQRSALPLLAAVALAGLAVVAWMASGYLGGGHSLALAVSALITAVYGTGLHELWGYRRDSLALARALPNDGGAAPEPGSTPTDVPTDAATWLTRLPPALRLTAQQRVAGQRGTATGPSLSPYLSGLLVLLGMLGTFLGMVVALQGTGQALDQVADLAAMREALAAPVRGLGLAFGTSVAGVATSAALGLLVTLLRRERAAAWQQLDRLLAGPWQGLTPAAHQARQAHQAAEAAAQAAAETAARATAQAEQQHQALLAAAHAQTGLQQQHLALQQRLLDTVQQQVQGHAAQLLALQAQAQALPELVRQLQTGMNGLSSGHQQLASQMQDAQRQLGDQLGGGQRQLAEQLHRSQQQLDDQLRHSQQQLAQQLSHTQLQWGEQLGKQHQQLSSQLLGAQTELAAQLEAGQARFHAETTAAYQGLAAAVSQGLQHSLAEGARLASDTLQPAVQQAMAALAQESLTLHRAFGERLQQELGQLSTQQAALAQAHSAEQARQAQAQAEHQAALSSQQAELQRQLAQDQARALAQALGGFTTGFAERSQALVDQFGAQAIAQTERTAAHWAQWAQTQAERLDRQLQQQAAELAAGWQAALQQHRADQQAQLVEQARQDAVRLATWAERLQHTTDTLSQTWAQAGSASTERMQALSDTLSRTAEAMGQQAEAHARTTLAEIHRLVDAAAEAPRVAAEVVGELRQKLSDSLVRDNAQLAERNQLLDTLGSLLATVQHASQEQRSAIDALVAGSRGLLAQAGQQFGSLVGQQTERFEAVVSQHGQRLDNLAAQLTGSAVDVASLGEAFGAGVAQFEASSQAMVGQLARIEAALGQSLARSDEQLAYYVAQAREVIDLSIGAQRQIVDDLQRIAEQRALSDSPVA